MVIHSGHSFSTSDVYDGLVWGLRHIGAEVVEYRWDKSQQTLGALAAAAVRAGALPEERRDALLAAAGSLAGSDAVVYALAHEVDAVLVINGLLFPPDRARVLARQGIPVGCYGTEAPYMEEAERQIAPFYTHWFTQERRSVGRYDVPTTYLPLAYHPERHVPALPDPDKACDVVFVGGGYPERKALLDGVDWAGIDHARVGTLWHLDLEGLAAQGVSPGAASAIYTSGSVPNEVTAAWHRSARISLNLHRRMTFVETLGSIAPGLAESCNPRVYEVPAVGGFLLCDDERPEVREVLGDSAALYRWGDSADLERQIRHWLAHPDARDRAAAAQAQAVAPHHYGARARTVLETLLAA